MKNSPPNHRRPHVRRICKNECVGFTERRTHTALKHAECQCACPNVKKVRDLVFHSDHNVRNILAKSMLYARYVYTERSFDASTYTSWMSRSHSLACHRRPHSFSCQPALPLPNRPAFFDAQSSAASTTPAHADYLQNMRSFGCKPSIHVWIYSCARPPIRYIHFVFVLRWVD